MTVCIYEVIKLIHAHVYTINTVKTYRHAYSYVLFFYYIHKVACQDVLAVRDTNDLVV